MPPLADSMADRNVCPTKYLASQHFESPAKSFTPAGNSSGVGSPCKNFPLELHCAVLAAPSGRPKWFVRKGSQTTRVFVLQLLSCSPSPIAVPANLADGFAPADGDGI